MNIYLYRSCRIGNIIFIISYYINNHSEDITNIIIKYENSYVNKYLDYFKKLFYKISFEKENLNYYRYSNEEFKKILNPSLCNFNLLKEIISYEYLDSLHKIDDHPYIAINMRYGDYINDAEIKDTYKAFNLNVFNKILNTQQDILNIYDTVYVISDDIELAKHTIQISDIGKLYNFNIIYNDVTCEEKQFIDLNYLIHADVIIGSCSTFSFSGYYLNKKNCKMFVEFPYYKYPNNLGFDEHQQDDLYNDANIIKVYDN